MENYFAYSHPSSSWDRKAEIAAAARTTRILKFIHQYFWLSYKFPEMLKLCLRKAVSTGRRSLKGWLSLGMNLKLKLELLLLYRTSRLSYGVFQLHGG